MEKTESDSNTNVEMHLIITIMPKINLKKAGSNRRTHGSTAYAVYTSFDMLGSAEFHYYN